MFAMIRLRLLVALIILPALAALLALVAFRRPQRRIIRGEATIGRVRLIRSRCSWATTCPLPGILT